MSEEKVTKKNTMIPQFKHEPDFDVFQHFKIQLRERFYKWPPHKKVKMAARSETVRFKKDGTKYKIPWVRYECNHCKGLFQGNRVQVDHVEPVEPVERVEYADFYDRMRQYFDRLFVPVEGLQILCKECHKKKSKEENAKRRENKKNG